MRIETWNLKRCISGTMFCLHGIYNTHYEYVMCEVKEITVLGK